MVSTLILVFTPATRGTSVTTYTRINDLETYSVTLAYRSSLLFLHVISTTQSGMDAYKQFLLAFSKTRDSIILAYL